MHSNRLCFVDFSTWDVTSVGSSRITGPTVIWYNPACYYTHFDFFLCQFWGFYSDEDGRILDFQCSCILSKWLACIKRKRVAFQLLLDHFDLVTFLRTIHYCHHSVFYHLCNGTVIIHRVLTWKQDNRVICIICNFAKWGFPVLFFHVAKWTRTTGKKGAGRSWLNETESIMIQEVVNILHNHWGGRGLANDYIWLWGDGGFAGNE